MMGQKVVVPGTVWCQRTDPSAGKWSRSALAPRPSCN